MDNIKYIAHITKRRGNSTWILNACLNDPSVIVICSDLKQVNTMRIKYNELKAAKDLVEDKKTICNWVKNLFKKKKYKMYQEETKPLFLTPASVNNIRGSNRPVIFDNYSIM